MNHVRGDQIRGKDLKKEPEGAWGCGVIKGGRNLRKKENNCLIEGDGGAIQAGFY